MKDRIVALGYLIDDNFVQKFFLNRVRSKGLNDDIASKGPFKRHVKASLARRAAQEAGCPVAVLNVNLPRETEPKEEAIFVSFCQHDPTYADTYPPTARELAKFKAYLFLDANDNPKWRIVK